MSLALCDKMQVITLGGGGGISMDYIMEELSHRPPFDEVYMGGN